MKKHFLSALALLSFSAMSAQANLEVGKLQLNGGFGFSGWGVPVYVGLDYGVHEDFTVGGEFTFRSHSVGEYNATIMGIMANGNYHFNRVLELPSNFDLYAGGTLGYYVWSWDHDIDGHHGYNSSGIGFSGQVGGRYFFNDKFGVNLELGGGSVNGGKLGITYKL